MIRAHSGDASLAHDGPPADLPPERVDDGVRRRIPAMVRLLWRLAFAVATVLVCVGISSPKLGIVDVVMTPFAAAVHDRASAERSAPRSSNEWLADTSSTEGDIKAAEFDLDEEDPLCDMGDDAALDVRRVAFPRGPERALRLESPTYRSRFTISARSPRGPPV